MSGKRKATPEAAPVLPRETAFQDAVVLVREPFVIDRTVAMQAMQFARERFAGPIAQSEAPSSQASSSRRRNGTTGR